EYFRHDGISPDSETPIASIVARSGLSGGLFPMRSLMRSSCALIFGLLLAAGCQEVKEDRSINFASDGSQVGFQHGQDGVYVADIQGTGLKKIFQPTEDLIAVSSPLFSPTDRRLIFTTAKAADGSKATKLDMLNPAGAVFLQQPVIY